MNGSLQTLETPARTRVNNLLSEALEQFPDIVANAGGVTCSYVEQVQGQSNYYWDGEEVVGVT